jgi:hypothetical protein
VPFLQTHRPPASEYAVHISFTCSYEYGDEGKTARNTYWPNSNGECDQKPPTCYDYNDGADWCALVSYTYDCSALHYFFLLQLFEQL